MKESDMKTKIALVAILAVGTLIGVSALVSAAHKADHGTLHKSSAHQTLELMLRAA
jgi:hypothetical protein